MTNAAIPAARMPATTIQSSTLRNPPPRRRCWAIVPPGKLPARPRATKGPPSTRVTRPPWNGAAPFDSRGDFSLDLVADAAAGSAAREPGGEPAALHPVWQGGRRDAPHTHRVHGRLLRVAHRTHRGGHDPPGHRRSSHHLPPPRSRDRCGQLSHLLQRPRRPPALGDLRRRGRPDRVKVPFLDLGAQDATVGRAVRAAVAEVLDGHQYILGPHLERFEAAMAAY